MRGRRNPQASLLAFIDLEERVPPHHPLRTMKRFADRALVALSATFDAMSGTAGRIDSARTVVEGLAVDQLVFGPQ